MTGSILDDPLGNRYSKLGCTISPLEKEADDHKMILKYLEKTFEPIQFRDGSFGVTVENIFKLDASAHPYHEVSKLPNKVLLWCGTRTSNLVRHIKQGFLPAIISLLAPGYMFGWGIYCTDAAAKAALYGFTAVDRPEGFLILAVASVGEEAIEMSRAPEVDADAEALSNGLNMQSKFFSSLPRNAFERALTLYKNAYVKIKSYSSPGANDPHKVIVASKSGKESFCHTKLYGETNADVDVTVVCDNTSTYVTSTIEFTNPLEHAVKNNTQTDQENPYMVLQDDEKMNNSISSSQKSPIFDVKEPIVNVKDANYLVLGCNTNSKGCSEHPLDDVNTRVFLVEPEDGVTDPEMVDDHDPRGFSEESNLNTIVSLEELTYGINSMHVSKAPVDPVDAVVLSEEQANIVGPLRVNNVPSLIKRNISILNTEEHKTMSNRHTRNIDFRVTENSSREFPVPIDSCTDIAVTNNAAAFLEISSSLSLKLVRECEGKSHSISMMPNSETVSQVSEFHERCDNVDLDTVNVGCLNPNQQDEHLCGEAGIQ